MSQSLDFNRAVIELYFDTDIARLPAGELINRFKGLALSHRKQRSGSLSISMDFGNDDASMMETHIFVFNNSPFRQATIESASLKISVGQARKVQRVLDIELIFHFEMRDQAEHFFELLRNKFTPLSTRDSYNEEDDGTTKISQFSNPDGSNSTIGGVTFFLGESMVSKKYEVKILPYNEFSGL
jgi:hypothetical protein